MLTSRSVPLTTAGLRPLTSSQVYVPFSRQPGVNPAGEAKPLSEETRALHGPPFGALVYPAPMSSRPFGPNENG